VVLLAFTLLAESGGWENIKLMGGQMNHERLEK